MTRESIAVLLDAGEDSPAAVARHEFIEVLTEVKSFRVPVAPPDCDMLVSWRGELIPAVDLRNLVGANDPEDSPARNLALVVAYQPNAGEPLQYACLWLGDYPRMVPVSDLQDCVLPPEKQNWFEISLGSFLLEDEAVPILDLPRIFSRDLAIRRRPDSVMLSDEVRISL